MRILYVHLYDNRFRMGGAGQVVLDLARSMKGKFGDEVACAVNSGDLAEALGKQKIPIFEIDLSKLHFFRTLSTMAKAIASGL